MARLSVTAEVQRFLSRRIDAGDTVIDATLGNGHDALFLARLIGDEGHLFGFDVQLAAISHTRNRLTAHQLDHRATLMMKSHADMADYIPERLHGRIRCIMFNLGYLPGGDKSLITRTASTLTALNQGCRLLSAHGCISVLAYSGHPGGTDESNAVKAWAGELSEDGFSVRMQNLLPEHKHPPQWILIEKKASHTASVI